MRASDSSGRPGARAVMKGAGLPAGHLQALLQINRRVEINLIFVFNDIFAEKIKISNTFEPFYW